jgi:hypothetical protein
MSRRASSIAGLASGLMALAPSALAEAPPVGVGGPTAPPPGPPVVPPGQAGPPQLGPPPPPPPAAQPPPYYPPYPPYPPPYYPGAAPYPYYPPSPAAPPAKVEAPKPPPLRFAARVSPFDLIMRRLSFEAEVAVWGPLAVGAMGSWIWGSPVDHMDEQGAAVLGTVSVYFQGQALRGFFVRAFGGYEQVDATLSHPVSPAARATETLQTGLFGAFFGNSTVFGRGAGFNLSGGIGLAVATSDPVTITTSAGQPGVGDARVVYFDDASRFRVLGNVGVGVAF